MRTFEFDNVYGPDTTTEDVFQEVKGLVTSFTDGCVGLPIRVAHEPREARVVVVLSLPDTIEELSTRKCSE